MTPRVTSPELVSRTFVPRANGCHLFTCHCQPEAFQRGVCGHNLCGLRSPPVCETEDREGPEVFELFDDTGPESLSSPGSTCGRSSARVPSSKPGSRNGQGVFPIGNPSCTAGGSRLSCWIVTPYQSPGRLVGHREWTLWAEPLITLQLNLIHGTVLFFESADGFVET